MKKKNKAVIECDKRKHDITFKRDGRIIISKEKGK